MISALLVVYVILLLAAGLGVLCWMYRVAFPRELLANENLAVAICFSGFFLGLTFALAGLFFGQIAENGKTCLAYWGLEGLLAFCLMLLTVWITDRLLLSRFPIAREITQDQNLGVACAVAGVCLSAGLVMNGVLCGYSESAFLAVRDIIVYWALAQFALWITLRVIIFLRPFDFVHQLEEDDNLASGLSLGFFVTSLGILARAAVLYSGRDGIWAEIGDSLLRFLLGLTILVGVLALGKLVLRRRGISIMDLELANSPAPILFWGTTQTALAVILGLLLQRAG